MDIEVLKNLRHVAVKSVMELRKAPQLYKYETLPAMSKQKTKKGRMIITPGYEHLYKALNTALDALNHLENLIDIDIEKHSLTDEA